MIHTRFFLTASASALLLAASSAGCGGADDSPGSSSHGNGGSGAGSTSDGGGGAVPPPPEPMRRKVSGDLTWKVTFDDVAKTAGAIDCSYARHYEGVEDASAKWLCPTCDAMFKVDVQLNVGLDDCFKQVSMFPPNEVEWIGYDANGTFRRGAGATMSEQGTATMTGSGFDMMNTVMDLDAAVGGKMAFGVSGSIAVSSEVGDVMNGFTPPATYACGWPKADPPAYTGDYVLAKGKTVPDGLFKDACDEGVRLHDLKGSYLFVEMSARNCGPCQQMATEEEQFIANMEAKGISVRVVTLLCPSLEDTVGETTKSMLDAWIFKYKLTSPVLADRGWGLSVLATAIGLDTVGYPSWALIDPELNVLDFGSGFGGFPEVETAILADAMP